MESLPSELLVDIFDRLNITDAYNCRLLTSRFDEIIMKKSIFVKKPTCSIAFYAFSDRNSGFNLSLRGRENNSLSRFSIQHDRIKVLQHKDKEFARLLARLLGAPDPFSDLYTKDQVVYYSGMKDALKVVIQIAQLKYSINTLEQNEIVNEDVLAIIVNQLPKNSVHNLIFVKPKSSYDILRNIIQIGVEGIQYIRFEGGMNSSRNETPSTDMMNFLIPHIPRINLNTGHYPVSFSIVKKVIENWLHSDWVISLCSFGVFGSSKWRELLISLNAEVEPQEKMANHFRFFQLSEVFHLKRGSDDHILRIMVIVWNESNMDIKLYEDEMYKDKFCIL